MKPTVGRLEETFKDKVEFQALNVDEASNAEAMKKYNFVGQPQFVVIGVDGKILSSRNGSQSFDKLKEDIEKALASAG
jgi:photosystem II stability/assembly factor-like uncharacterized protein